MLCDISVVTCPINLKLVLKDKRGGKKKKKTYYRQERSFPPSAGKSAQLQVVELGCYLSSKKIKI